MLDFEEARARWLGAASPLGAERVPLEACSGRVLRERLVSARPLPAADHSSMDGFAVSIGDLAGEGPWTLPVVGVSAAGGVAPALAPGTTCRIFTGAELPAGSDAVIPQEDVERREGAVVVARRPQRGAFIRRRGEDLAAGAVALPEGVRLTPGRLALAATLDRAHLCVGRRPLVHVLCTGDELRAPGDPDRPGSLPESNGPMLAALVARAGGAVRLGPFVRDEPEGAERAIREGLAGADVLLTVGGVSVGDRDVVRPALARAGVTLDFWRVAMKPGKPLAVGSAGATKVLALPGNPVSAMVTFVLFGIPLLRALQGDRAPLPPPRRARLERDVEHAPGRLEFVRARLVERGEHTGVEPLANQASGAVTSLAEADALLVLPADRTRFAAGETAEVVRLDDV